MRQRGLLLFAHGARDPRWSAPFEAVAASVRAQQPDVAVVLAFLEFMAPTLADAGRTLVARGCTEIDVVPLFLGSGGHVRKDLPLLLAALQAEEPQTQWRLQPAIGEARGVIEAMASAALGLLGGPSADAIGVIDAGA